MESQYEGRYIIENCTKGRYLFQTDRPAGEDGGSYPKCVGADADYLGRAIWKIIPKEDNQYLIQNEATGLYLYQTGSKVDPNQTIGAYANAPLTVGVDCSAAGKWTILYEGERHLIRSVETLRMLLQLGDEITGERGSEEGWAAAPNCVGSDKDYYGLAKWKLLKQ